MNFDFIVVGAGIAGTSIAAELAEMGSVVLLEAEHQSGYHATGRSAALFSTIYGGPVVRSLSRASRDFFHAPPAEVFDGPLLKRRGTLFVATQSQRETLRAFAALEDIAAETRLLEAKAAVDLCPALRSDRVVQAVYEEHSAGIDVHALQQGYFRRLRRAGGNVLNGHRLDALSRSHGQWTAVANGATFVAPIIVNAAGAWADEVAALGGVVPIGIVPKRRTAVIIDPPPGQDPVNWPAVIDIDEQFYFMPDAGALLLSPADETPSAPCDAQPDEWDVAVAIDRVERVTTLAPRSVKRSWAGLRSFVADREPVAGFDAEAPGFFWLAGQGGYGIQTAPALARIAAEIISGSGGAAVHPEVSRAALSPLRLPLQDAPIPLLAD